MKLLVVDDSSEFVEILSSTMKLSGHSVDGANDGMEAIELLRSNTYDVVITDAQMPGMNGIEVCKFLRATFPAVYVIGMSGSPHALNDFKNAGADVCFTKPFSTGKMEEAIGNRFHHSPPNLTLPRHI